MEIFAADDVQGSITRHRAKFRQDQSNRYRDITIYRFLQDGGGPPSWICWRRVRATHEQYASVLTVIKSLVEIGAVASIIW